jgi:predicted MFS family arabinose efflux permease
LAILEAIASYFLELTDMDDALAETTRRPAPALSARLAVLLAAVGGLLAANLYYAQPLIGIIGPSLGLSPEAAGLVVTVAQLGYGVGLVLIVPLGDLFENRHLILLLGGCCVLALVGAALSASPALFLSASMGVGISSVVLQIIVPYASHLAPEAVRGRIVGFMQSGQMLGIMLARPVAILVADQASWHAVFALSAACLLVAFAVLALALPRRAPPHSLGYGKLLLSMAHLARGTPILQRRAFYHASLFAAFSLFWTTAPLLLAGPDFRMSQIGIACFALAGAAGVVAAPFAGSLADRGWTRPATGLALTLVALCFPLTWLGPIGSTERLTLLAAAGVLLGIGVSVNVVLGQRAIFLLQAEHRSRLNGLFMAAFYMSGALGSAIGAWAYAHGGWALASAIGLAMPLAALIAFATELRTVPRSDRLQDDGSTEPSCRRPGVDR